MPSPRLKINNFLKQRDIFRAVESAYTGCCFHPEAGIDLGSWDKLIEELAKKMHDGDLEPSQLSKEYISKTYEKTNEASALGYGKKWGKFPLPGEDRIVIELKKNLYQFSCAKSLAQLEDMNRMLYDKSGKLSSWGQFKENAQASGMKFNQNYLQAEYQTARQAASSARKWQDYQEAKDLFPNLEYRTVGDSRVRPEHEILNGTIKPIDDPFWRTYYPPNAWRCRCYVVQTAATVTKGKHEDNSVTPEFKGNVALDEEIFSRKGNFFKLMALDSNAERNAEFMKLNAPTETAHETGSGKKVNVSIFAHLDDKMKNVETATVIAEKLNKNILVRAHLNVSGHKNPEYEIDGMLADRKEQTGTAVENNIRKAKRQGCEVIIFDVTSDYPNSLNRFKNDIKGTLKAHYPNVFKKIIIVNGSEVEEIMVKDLLK
ncbi:hypothetical protein ATE49_04420 [Elizabethkingia miricola]|uniref:SPP1 gp7 family putative phage head morphogenesis protein n=1 Tax=Elizabethkingia miricola TaxID=172045 RepID=A0ABY3NAK4_ELIMR|nr:phage minor head protein [Elizabethkingia miricola]OBS12731.1 hypothetical protein ATE49_04420 [Elizabethkingia miricola]TYO84536.1 SPP1 gp7 family putative phage head morphogenesis protein [Elizabethkingia miricola]